MMQNSDDTATLEIFFLHTYSLFIVYSFPQKMHTRMLLVLKLRESIDTI